MSDLRVCQVCGGVIYRIEIIKGHPHKSWLHLHDEDWKDDPHNAVPNELVERQP